MISFAICKPVLVIAAITLVGCAAKKEHASPAAPADPTVDSLSQVTVYSASQPQRNPAPELGKGDAPSLMQVANDCNATVCVGNPSDALIEAVRSQAVEARTCYEAALRKSPNLAGRVLLNLRISHDGSSCPFGIAQNELAESTTLVPCLRELLQKNYPRPTGGCVELNLPLKFVPEYIDSDAGAPGSAPTGSTAR